MAFASRLVFALDVLVVPGDVRPVVPVAVVPVDVVDGDVGVVAVPDVLAPDVRAPAVLAPDAPVAGTLVAGAAVLVVGAAAAAVVTVLVVAGGDESPAASLTSAAASTPSDSATSTASVVVRPFQLGDAARRVRAAAPQCRHHSCSGCSGAPQRGHASPGGVGGGGAGAAVGAWPPAGGGAATLTSSELKDAGSRSARPRQKQRGLAMAAAKAIPMALTERGIGRWPAESERGRRETRARAAWRWTGLALRLGRACAR
jgi:hypothetical protein